MWWGYGNWKVASLPVCSECSQECSEDGLFPEACCDNSFCQARRRPWCHNYCNSYVAWALIVAQRIPLGSRIFFKVVKFFFFFSSPLTFAYFLRDNFCFTEFVFVFYFCVIVLWKLTASSSSLVQCFGGIGYLQHCQPGLFFNENTHTCDFPFNIPCCQA